MNKAITSKSGTWLFLQNPFTYLAGVPSLIFGLLILIILSTLGHFFGFAFDGVIDVHQATKPRLWLLSPVEQAVDWLLPALGFYLSGILLSPSKIRWVDVLGTTAMARISLLAVVLVIAVLPADAFDFSRGVENIGNKLVYLFPLALSGLLSIFLYIRWLYQAYIVACNVKGNPAKVSFIAVMVIAEIARKVILISLYQHLIK